MKNITLATIVSATLMATPAKAIEYPIDMTGAKPHSASNWELPFIQPGLAIGLLLYDMNGDGESDVTVKYQMCNGETSKTPWGVYDDRTKQGWHDLDFNGNWIEYDPLGGKRSSAYKIPLCKK